MTVKDKMQLLGFQDITTPRQNKNGKQQRTVRSYSKRLKR